MGATVRAGPSGDGRARPVSGWNAAWSRRVAAAALCALAAAGHAQFSDVTVTAASATSLRVTWRAPVGGDDPFGPGGRNPVQGYDVRYRKRQETVSRRHPTTGTATTTTIGNLDTGEIYFVKVRALRGGRWGSYSFEANGVPEDTSAGALAGLAANATSGSSVGVSWNAVLLPVGVTGYEVRHQGGATLFSSMSGWTSKSVTGTSTTLSGLTPGHYYAVRVCSSIFIRSTPRRRAARPSCMWENILE